MQPIEPDDLSTKGLAQLLDLQMPLSWSNVDAVAALRHQLATPVFIELKRLPGMEVALKHFTEGSDTHRANRDTTFLDYLQSASPDVAVLEMIKNYSRRVDEDEANPLRGMPARVLYFAAIAAALTGCDVRITQSTDQALTEGFSWCRVVLGAEPLKDLFTKAIQRLQ